MVGNRALAPLPQHMADGTVAQNILAQNILPQNILWLEIEIAFETILTYLNLIVPIVLTHGTRQRI